MKVVFADRARRDVGEFTTATRYATLVQLSASRT
jgi:hypothetical protein